MSRFATQWLDLREGADLAARNGDLCSALEARFAQRDKLSVVDLGCGTGANLRAVASLLPGRQRWVLIDHDADLIEAARDRLCTWAHRSCSDGKALQLEKEGREISVAFRQADLASGLKDLLADAPDLITASALFDLTSRAFINEVAQATAACKAVLYGVLTYNGRQAWHPRSPSDNAVIAAFNKHQTGDKGFGAAAGPAGADILADRLRAHGYAVQEADSPWQLDNGDLLQELIAGTAAALADRGDVDEAMLERWRRTARRRVEIGHTDVLGVPG